MSPTTAPGRSPSASASTVQAGSQVALGQPARSSSDPPPREVVDQPMLHGGVEHHADTERDRARQPASRVLQVRGAEAEAGQQQRAPQGLALPRSAVGGQVVDDLGHDRAARVAVLGGERVGPEPDGHVVVFLVGVGQPAAVRHGRVRDPGGGGEGQPALAVRADRRGGAVPLAGEADPVVAVADRRRPAEG